MFIYSLLLNLFFNFNLDASKTNCAKFQNGTIQSLNNIHVKSFNEGASLVRNALFKPPATLTLGALFEYK